METPDPTPTRADLLAEVERLRFRVAALEKALYTKSSKVRFTVAADVTAANGLDSWRVVKPLRKAKSIVKRWLRR